MLSFYSIPLGCSCPPTPQRLENPAQIYIYVGQLAHVSTVKNIFFGI